MRRLFFCLFFGTLLIVSAVRCVSMPQVSSERYLGVDFSRLKTFNWLTSAWDITGEARIDKPILDSRIRNAVERELEALGYLQRTAGSPDFLINYRLSVKENVEVSPVGHPQALLQEFAKGTLIIEAMTPDTKNVLWRGKTHGEMYRYGFQVRKLQHIDKTVREIIKQFPRR